MEWISAASMVGQRLSMPGSARLSQLWKAWPISWVKTPISPCVPVKLAKM